MTDKLSEEAINKGKISKKKVLSNSKITRSRTGCHFCKKLKIKCDERKPSCSYCLKCGILCDYSLKLTWGGRPYKNSRKKNGDYTTSIYFEEKNFEPSSKIKIANIVNPPLQFLVNTGINNSSRKSSTKFPTISDSINIGTIALLKESKDIPTCNNNENDKKININYSNYYNPRAMENTSSNLPFTMSNRDSILFHDLYDFNVNESVDVLDNSIINKNIFKDKQPQIQSSKNVDISNEYECNILCKNIPTSPYEVENTFALAHNIENQHINQVKYYSQINYEKIDRNYNNPQQLLQLESKHNEYFDENKAIEHFALVNQSHSNRDFYNSPDTIILTSKNNRHFINNSINELSLLDLKNQNYESISIFTPDQIFSTVPPQFTPLPDLLLQVPFYRDLLNFWVNVVADSVSPVPSQICNENPCKVILPQMAMEYTSILTAILAISANTKYAATRIDYIKEIVNQLISMSYREVISQLQSTETAISDSTLTTVLLLSCNEVYFSMDLSKYKVHIIGAQQIIKERYRHLSSTPFITDKQLSILTMQKFRSNKLKDHKVSDLTLFLYRIIIYFEVFGALSATNDTHDYLNPGELEICDIINILERELLEGSNSFIDHISGFDIRYLAYFKEIVLLIRSTEAYTKNHYNISELLPILLTRKALELKENIMKLYKEGEINFQKSNSTGFNSIGFKRQNQLLRYTNKMFCDMSILNLYRRVMKLPRESHIIQDIANEILQIVQDYIEPKSLAEVCTKFCIFVGACETLDPKMQKFALQRFTQYSEMGDIITKQIVQILQRCWTTGCDWQKAARDLNIDIAIL